MSNSCKGAVGVHVQAMLDQYSGRDRGIHKLDSALKDAVQMVRVSDERISYLRKMHALLLLKRCVALLLLNSAHKAVSELVRLFFAPLLCESWPYDPAVMTAADAHDGWVGGMTGCEHCTAGSRRRLTHIRTMMKMAMPHRGGAMR